MEQAPPCEVVFWNVHGFKNISNDFLAGGAPIKLLYETWMTHCPNNLGGPWSSYQQFWIPAIKEKSLGRASGGMVLLIKKEIEDIEILDSCNWWIFVKITLKRHVFVVGGVYFSPALDIKIALELLQTTMCEIYDKYKDCMIITGGDFNARIGLDDEVPEDIFEASNLHKRRKSLDQVRNGRGIKLQEFMEENSMIVINGRTKSDRPANFTFSAEIGNSTVDLVWVNIEGIKYVRDLFVHAEASLSDHFPVSIQTNFQTNSVRIEKTRNGPPIKRVKYDRTGANDFGEIVRWSDRLGIDFQGTSPNSQFTNFCEALMEAADRAGMLKTVSPSSQVKSHKNKPWFDAQCLESKKRLQSALRICKARHFNEDDKANYMRTKKEHKALLENRKNEYENNLRDRLAGTHDPSTFWEVVRAIRGRVISAEVITVEEWSQFYSTVFHPREEMGTNFHYFGVLDPTTDREITLQEVERALRKCKNGKAPGCDLIPNELLKALPNNWKYYLVAMFNKILSVESVPKAWSTVLLTMLHKKGDRKEPSNYRGIALVSCTAKLFTHILRARIEAWEEVVKVLPEAQAGFRKARGCEDNIFALQSAVQLQLRLKGRKVYALFVDFKRAFDSVDQAKLWNKLFSFGLSAKILRVLKSLYDGATLRVRSGGELSKEVEITEGVLQGEILSPLLFILFIADLEQELRKNGLVGVNIDGVNDLLMLLYADDLVILADSQVDLNRKLRALDTYCRANSLSINTSKTKIVPCRSGGSAKESKFFYREEEIETVSTYTYLGVPFASSSLGLKAANSAVTKSKFATGSVTALLQRAKSDAWESKAKLYDSIVSATLLYGAHIWGLRYADVLERAQLNFFKKLLLLPRDTPSYAVRMELGLTHIAFKLLNAAWSWIVRLLRMEDSRLPKLCLMRLVWLHRHGQALDNKYNWVKQVDECLEKIDSTHLWDDMNPELWERSREECMRRYQRHLKMQDYSRMRDGQSLQTGFPSFPRTPGGPRAPYLDVRVNLPVTRILAQLRLATMRTCNLSYGGMTHKLTPGELCTLCNRNEPETVEHFICRCPIYGSARAQYLGNLSPVIQGYRHLNQILEVADCNSMRAVFHYVTSSLRLRAFILNE